MKKYKYVFTDEFLKDLKKFRRDSQFLKRLYKKIDEILEMPFHYKPLRNVLKNKRRTHIGSFVLIFEVFEKERNVHFFSLKHHDVAY